MIPLLVPDLPTAEELLPWLQQIDANKWYTNFGPLVQQFEGELLQYLKKYSSLLTEQEFYLTTTNSGTSAIELALSTLDLPAGSCILLPAFTFPATATAVLSAGYIPVFTDVDDDIWALTPEIAKSISSATKIDAVLPVASFGYSLDAQLWDDFYLDTQIPVIIDAAAAFGNQKIPQHCTVTFSLHATKAFGIGEGGIVVSSSEEMIKQIKTLSNFGFQEGSIAQAGCNAKLSEYHAAVGLAQFKRWNKIKAQRIQLTADYIKILKNNSAISWNKAIQNNVSSVFPVTFNADINIIELADFLDGQGILTRFWYAPPLHEHHAFKHYSYFGINQQTELMHTKKLNNSLLGIPFHTRLTADNLDYIGEYLNKGILKNGK